MRFSYSRQSSVFASPQAQRAWGAVLWYDPQTISARIGVAQRCNGQGENGFIWTGRDSKGRGQASGAYYVKAEAGEQTWTHKLMLIK
jgi:hypothetical protein